MLQSRGSLEELIDDLNVCQDEELSRPLTASQSLDKTRNPSWRSYQRLYPFSPKAFVLGGANPLANILRMNVYFDALPM